MKKKNLFLMMLLGMVIGQGAFAYKWDRNASNGGDPGKWCKCDGAWPNNCGNKQIRQFMEAGNEINEHSCQRCCIGFGSGKTTKGGTGPGSAPSQAGSF